MVDQGVYAILDETIQALAFLDLDRLQAAEKEVRALAKSGAVVSRENINLILAKKRLLELILQHCKSNLDALNHLHGKNTREQWAH
jgi:hypothetical protein